MDQNDFMPLFILAGIPAIFFFFGVGVWILRPIDHAGRNRQCSNKFSIAGVGIWLLRPIDQVGRNRQGSIKFSIADFLSLFVTVQVPLSLLALLREGTREEYELKFIILVLAWIGGPLIWWTAAKAISKAGINHGWRRIILMAVVMPIVYYGLLPFSIAATFCCFGLFIGEVGISSSGMRWSVALTVFLGCALLLCGVATRKIVATLDR